MIHCSNCGKEFQKGAKFCPYCRNPIKKEIYKQWWFWLIIIFWFFVIVGVLGEDTETNNSINNSNNNSSEKSNTIEYLKVDIDDLENDLDNNAAAASEKYKGKYLEIVGKLGTIDSSLRYFIIKSTTNKWDIGGIHCNLRNSKTREIIKTLNRDQIISVKGQVTDVGEVLGYYLNVDEIIPQ